MGWILIVLSLIILFAGFYRTMEGRMMKMQDHSVVYHSVRHYSVGMLSEAEILVEHWWLATGGTSYRFTHLPTGIAVSDAGPSNATLIERLQALRQQLEAAVHEAKERDSRE
jgi:hypothetical protein